MINSRLLPAPFLRAPFSKAPFLRAPFLRAMLATMLATTLLAGAAPVLAQSVTPDVSVREEADQTIREYRVNGKLYAIRVEPSNGSAYFLVDRSGNGNFERQQGDSVPVPDWVK